MNVDDLARLLSYREAAASVALDGETQHVAAADGCCCLDHARERIVELEAAKDTAYSERDRLVVALSKVFPSHLCRHPDEDADWEDDWRWIVCVHLPTGQATWHIHDSERSWFAHLSVRDNHWDGHSTEEKYSRLAALEVTNDDANE